MTKLEKKFNRIALIDDICDKIRQEVVKHAFDYCQKEGSIYVYDDMVEVIYCGSFINTQQPDESVGYIGEVGFFLEKIQIRDTAYSRNGIELKNFTNILKTIFK